jgi:diguanylate cyclase (GGDEF)-like protein
VIYLDCDDFKRVNDSLGHQAGDQYLAEVSGRLVACVRPEDTVARLGGDEFAILLENTGPENAVLAPGASSPRWPLR